MALQHMRDAKHLTPKIVEAAVGLAGHGDLDKHQQPRIKRDRRNMGVIAGNHSVAFQSFDSLYARRNRQTHGLGQFRHGHAAVTLQQIQNVPIEFVERVNRITLYSQGLAPLDRMASGR